MTTTEEPIYTFVKGEGWVVKPPVETVVIHTSHGRYTIIDRPPQPGEYYGLFSKTNHSYVQDGKVLINVWAKHILERDMHYENYCLYEVDQVQNHSQRYLLCTLVVG